MSLLFTSAKIALVFLAAGAGYATWYIFLNNGTIDQITKILDVGPQLLPGTNEPLRIVYTGVPVIDRELTVLVLFFWETIDGSNPAACLFQFLFAMEVACGWGLLMIESLRHGNRWSLISFIGIWGMVMQTVTYAVIIPFWSIIYLSTSPMVSSRRVSDFLVDAPNVAGIAVSMILGFALPTFRMAMPAPWVVDHDLKQWRIAMWQFFPVWTSIVQAVVPYLLPWLAEASGAPTSRRVFSMRLLYAGLIITAGIGQVATFTLIGMSNYFPDLFAPEYVGAFHNLKVFQPVATSPSVKMPSIGTGALLLLQFDQNIGSLALTVWSTVLFTNTYRKGATKLNVLLIIAGGILLRALAGPLGYVTACIWARDELIFADAEVEGKKVQ